MRGNGIALVVAMLLAVTATALADVPQEYLSWSGNHWIGTGTGGNFYRLFWLQLTDPYDPEVVLYEYKIPEITYQFTASVDATVQGVRLLLGSSDACDYQPNVTISFQTDDGSGNPSDTVVGTSWTGGVGYWSEEDQRWLHGSPIGGSPYDFPVSANLVQDTVYHLRVTVNNMDTPVVVGGGTGAGGVDFRIMTANTFVEDRGSNPATWDWDKYMTRSYDGVIDENMYGKYWDEDSSSWRTGADADEYFKLKTPIFEAYSLIVEDPGADSGYSAAGPIAELSQGYRSGTTRSVNDTTYTGERLAGYAAAVPSARKVKLRAMKTMYGGTWVWNNPDNHDEGGYWDPMPSNPDAPLIVELQDPAGNFLAKAEIDPSSLPWDDQATSLAGGYGWAEADLTDAAGDPIGIAASVAAGAKLIVKTDGLANGTYSIQVHQGGTLPMDGTNTYLGQNAYEVQSNDGGLLWASNLNQDILFSLAVIIPGDANGSHGVDIGDLAILGTSYGQTGKDWAAGDFNGDGAVNIGDLAILGIHYGEHLPEPATIGLLVVAAAAMLRRRRFS